jgi:hypothetical protein
MKKKEKNKFFSKDKGGIGCIGVSMNKKYIAVA